MLSRFSLTDRSEGEVCEATSTIQLRGRLEFLGTKTGVWNGCADARVENDLELLPTPECFGIPDFIKAPGGRGGSCCGLLPDDSPMGMSGPL